MWGNSPEPGQHPWHRHRHLASAAKRISCAWNRATGSPSSQSQMRSEIEETSLWTRWIFTRSFSRAAKAVAVFDWMWKWEKLGGNWGELGGKWRTLAVGISREINANYWKLNLATSAAAVAKPPFRSGASRGVHVACASVSVVAAFPLSICSALGPPSSASSASCVLSSCDVISPNQRHGCDTNAFILLLFCARRLWRPGL